MNGSNGFSILLGKIRSGAKTAVDSSLFIYHFEKAECYLPLTDILFEKFSQKKLLPVTSVITVVEVLTKPMADKDQRKIDLFQEIFSLREELEIVPLDLNLAPAVASLRGKYGLRLPDACQLAAALLARAEIFITNDEKLKKVKELKIICPSDFAGK